MSSGNKKQAPAQESMQKKPKCQIEWNYCRDCKYCKGPVGPSAMCMNEEMFGYDPVGGPSPRHCRVVRHTDDNTVIQCCPKFAILMSLKHQEKGK